MQAEEQFVPETEAGQMRELYRMLQVGAPLLRGPNGEEMHLPISVFQILKEVARNMQMGRAVSVVPRQEQMTTQMAANILGCSRPHLIKLLERSDIPFQRVGMHRRVRYVDLMAYQKRRDSERRHALQALAEEAVQGGSYVGVPIDEGGSDE